MASMVIKDSTDKSGRPIYCIGGKYFYTREKAVAHSAKMYHEAMKKLDSKPAKAAKSRKSAAKTRGTSTASDAYHWLHAGRRNPKRNPHTGRFVRRNR